jgi:hypothetical protein
LRQVRVILKDKVERELAGVPVNIAPFGKPFDRFRAWLAQLDPLDIAGIETRRAIASVQPAALRSQSFNLVIGKRLADPNLKPIDVGVYPARRREFELEADGLRRPLLPLTRRLKRPRDAARIFL